MKHKAEVLTASVLRETQQGTAAVDDVGRDAGSQRVPCEDIHHSSPGQWAGKYLWSSKNGLKSSYFLKVPKHDLYDLVFSLTQHLPAVSESSILPRKSNMWCVWDVANTLKHIKNFWIESEFSYVKPDSFS